MADQDPFAVFGDDNDDDDSIEAISSSEATKLIERANEEMVRKSQTVALSKTNDTQRNVLQNDTALDMPTLERVNLSWDPPLYIGLIACVYSQDYGGGRGFVATRDLDPGTLIIVEEPVIEWPKEQLGAELGVVSILHILEQDSAQKLIYDLEDFHPTKGAVDEFKVGDVQVKDMIEKLEDELGDGLPALIDLAKVKRLSNRDGTALDARDMVRLLLALRYNGFESGVYLHLAMLNHDSYPNSVKFVPTITYSEVRTTRHVRKGEALTISYLPNVMSHASRRHHLWEQHLFDIAGDVPDEYKEIELVGGNIPYSSPLERDVSAVTSRIESTIGALDGHFREMSAFVLENRGAENPVWEEAKALELASLELYTEAKDQLQNDRHVLLIPCLRLHLDLCDLLQIGKVLTQNQHVLLLFRIVTSCSNLIELQTRLYGKDHFDLARTYNELSQALAELLSTAPKKLVSQGFDGLESVTACSTSEHKARKEFQRIRALYPNDSEQFIRKLDVKS
jgi:SET domain